MKFTVSKIIIASLFIIFLVISSVFFSITVLKDETIKTHLKLVQLYSSIFVDNLSKTINTIDLFTDSLVVLLKNEEKEEIINNKLLNLLKENLEIRSINILDENNKIIYSSNKLNKNLLINLESFYPIPTYSKDILRVGNTKEGRDFFDAKNIEYSKNNLDINFFPILKEVSLGYKRVKVLIAINGDFLLNRYNNFLNIEHCYIDILKIDGTLLVSNDFREQSNIDISDELKTIIKEKNSFSGIFDFNKEKTILSYNSTLNYPFLVIVRLNFDKTLQTWEEKSYTFLVTIFALLILSIILIISWLITYNKRINKEFSLNKKFKILFEQSSFFALIVDSDGKILDINKSFLSLFFENKIEDKNIWEYSCWPESEKKWLESIFRNYTDGEKVQKELNIYDLDGKPRVLEIVISSFEIDEHIEYVLIALDITIKKQREKELKNAHIVFKNAHDGIVVTDDKANIVNVNKAFELNTGYTLKEVVGRNPKILKSGLQEEDFYKNMWTELISTGYWEGEITNKDKNGKLYIERIKINAVYNENNKLTNYIAVFSDITLQKEQERLLHEKEKLLFQQSKLSAMGEMIGNIAHQWRQPLSVISSSTSAIKLHEEEGFYSKEEIIDFIEVILNSTKYLSNTIDDFRNFYKEDSVKSNFDVKQAINSSLNLIKTELVKHNIELVFVNDDNFEIKGIRNQFLQVMMNILINAKDAFIEKEEDLKLIFINLYEEEGKKIIEIYDNAGGINENVIAHVFEPYFTTKHKSVGTGIGLYMSEEIITKGLNGEIFVSNKNFVYKNQKFIGAEFRIII
ncbi:PAS domain S-box protein [Arcobacter sp. L]|uniref:PAS domain S-box protein n=1 Tax=Arcobacter sp. L TaxID=944547 RepID=UPI00022962D6|nr:PAS domain S-box protein [Arcobacter sp. L]BAK73631.1 two-component sensor kinase [Arcobacter sp. L]